MLTFFFFLLLYKVLVLQPLATLLSRGAKSACQASGMSKLMASLQPRFTEQKDCDDKYGDESDTDNYLTPSPVPTYPPNMRKASKAFMSSTEKMADKQQSISSRPIFNAVSDVHDLLSSHRGEMPFSSLPHHTSSPATPTSPSRALLPLFEAEIRTSSTPTFTTSCARKTVTFSATPAAVNKPNPTATNSAHVLEENCLKYMEVSRTAASKMISNTLPIIQNHARDYGTAISVATITATTTPQQT